MSEKDTKEYFSDLVYECMMSAIHRQLAFQEELFRANGICVQNQIAPLVKDLIQKLEKATLSTKLIQLFQQTVKQCPTFGRLQEDLNQRVSAALTLQMKREAKRNALKGTKQPERKGKYA